MLSLTRNFFQKNIWGRAWATRVGQASAPEMRQGPGARGSLLREFHTSCIKKRPSRTNFELTRCSFGTLVHFIFRCHIGRCRQKDGVVFNVCVHPLVIGPPLTQSPCLQDSVTANSLWAYCRTSTHSVLSLYQEPSTELSKSYSTSSAKNCART